jgi:hypothetical protein
MSATTPSLVHAQVAPFLDVCLLQGAPASARTWSVGAAAAALVRSVGAGGKKKADKGKGSAEDMHEGYMLAVLTQFGGCVACKPRTRNHENSSPNLLSSLAWRFMLPSEAQPSP